MISNTACTAHAKSRIMSVASRQEQLDWVRGLRQTHARWENERSMILCNWQEAQETWAAEKQVLQQSIDELTNLSADERECFVTELEKVTEEKMALQDQVEQLQNELAEYRALQSTSSSSEWQVERAQLLAMIQVLEAQQNERVAESAPAVHVAPVDSAQDAPVNTPLTSSQSELLDSAKVAEVKSMLKKISSLKQELNSARDKRSSSKSLLGQSAGSADSQ